MPAGAGTCSTNEKSEDKPIRICVSNIGKALGIRALLERHMDKLPKTVAYIQRTVESDMDFRLRRVEWAAKEMKENGDNLIEWRILKKAGIRVEYMDELHDIIGQILVIKI